MTRIAALVASSLICLLGAQAQSSDTFKEIDSNANGMISQGEYLAWRTADGTVSPTDAAKEFVAMDKDRDGIVSRSEFAKATEKKTPSEPME